MNTINFRVLKLKASKVFICGNCGKKVKKQITIEESLNPYNKNKNGTIKSMSDINESLEEMASMWKLKQGEHKCKP